MAWTEATRAAAFWMACIPSRVGIALAAATAARGSASAAVSGTLLVILGVSQLYLYITNRRVAAPEGGGRTWWAPYRVMFGATMASAGIVTLYGVTGTWRYLPLVDPMLGAAVWLIARPVNG
jgi:hypothetical protein